LKKRDKRGAARSGSASGLPTPPRRGSPRARPRAIIADTREKKPFQFKGYRVKRVALKTGDYSVDGFQGVVAVERKTAEDMVNTLMVGRDRFSRELARAAELDRFVVVVESSMAGMVLSANGRTSAGLRPLLSRLSALSSQHGVSVLFCDNRAMAEIVCLEVLRPFLAN
jgi:ERCC4-type nuclease